MKIIGVEGHSRIRLDEKNDRLYCRFVSYYMVFLITAQTFGKQMQHIYCMAVESAIYTRDQKDGLQLDLETNA